MSEETLVERVAKEMHHAEKRHEVRVAWKEMPDEHRETYRDDARAIIEEVADAVREHVDTATWENWKANDGRAAVADWLRAQAREDG